MAEWFKFDLISEANLSASAGSANWMLCDCGHDCCTCDAECK